MSRKIGFGNIEDLFKVIVIRVRSGIQAVLDCHLVAFFLVAGKLLREAGHSLVRFSPVWLEYGIITSQISKIEIARVRRLG